MLLCSWCSWKSSIISVQWKLYNESFLNYSSPSVRLKCLSVCLSLSLSLSLSLCLTLTLICHISQSTHNAAARLITATRRTEHITTSSTVTSLATGLTTDSVQVSGSSPQVSQWPCSDYLTDHCCWTRHRRPGLRSSSVIKLLEVPSTRMTFGDRSLLLTDHVSGTVYRRHFTTQHYQLLSFLIDLRLISSFNSCSVCNSEQMSI